MQEAGCKQILERSLAPAGAFLLAVCLAPPPAIAQQPEIPEEIRSDSDPTKPVLFSLRNEYYDLKNGVWNDVVILRKDLIIFDRVELPGRARGIIVRGDLPLVTTSVGGKTHFGLGDLYAQGIVVPRLGGPFTIAY